MNKTKRIVTEAQQNFSFTRRALVLGGTQLAVGAVLAARMAYISIAQNERYSLLAEKQSRQPDLNAATARMDC